MTDRFPKYVKLRNPNPYPDGRVVCNGIELSETTKTLIVNPTMMKKLDLVKHYIEEVS